MKIDGRKQFEELWPKCVSSMDSLYGELMPLPDERYLEVREKLQYLSSKKVDTVEIEKVIRQLLAFDARFFGSLFGYDYEWAVYSLCYLCKDEEVIQHLLNIYIPLLSGFLQEELGKNFHVKVGLTFMDDVGHVLWDLEGLKQPGDHALFDWHGNRNGLSLQEIETFLQFAGLPPLQNPDFPPCDALLRFTNLMNPFDSEVAYVIDLLEFYREKGYDIDPTVGS